MARSTSGSASGSMKKLTVRPFMVVLRSRSANQRVPGYDALLVRTRPLTPAHRVSPITRRSHNARGPVDGPTGQGRVSRSDHPSKGWVSGLELLGDARSQS